MSPNKPVKTSTDNTAIAPPSLQDKVVLVTGAAHRIGASIARLLHTQGARLVLHYRGSRESAHRLQEELNSQRKDSVVLVQADLLDSKKLTAVIRNAVSICCS